MLLGERVFAVFPGFGHDLVLVPQQGAVLDVDGGLEIGRLVGIHFCPDVVVDKEHDTVRMVRQD